MSGDFAPDRECAGCGLPLEGMRPNARYHNESCRSARRTSRESPASRFWAAVGLIPRNGPMIAAIHARTRRNPVSGEA